MCWYVYFPHFRRSQPHCFPIALILFVTYSSFSCSFIFNTQIWERWESSHVTLGIKNVFASANDNWKKKRRKDKGMAAGEEKGGEKKRARRKEWRDEVMLSGHLTECGESLCLFLIVQFPFCLWEGSHYCLCFHLLSSILPTPTL